MKTEAIKLGIQLIEFEKDLEIGFQNNSVNGCNGHFHVIVNIDCPLIFYISTPNNIRGDTE
tara:strand:- start:192 stop:374 length:183 start_codon:yes stop_codon:yes gene_type:complete